MTERRSVIPLRSAGVLLHVSSLPGDYGIGDFGSGTELLLSTLQRSAQSYWQILPLGVPQGESPYQCLSAFAGNPLFIDLAELIEMDLLEPEELPEPLPSDRPTSVTKARAIKLPLLAKAAERFTARRKSDYDRFCRREAGWLDDFALFSVLRDRFDGAHWTQWDKPLARRRPDALAEARRTFAAQLDRVRFEQFMFDRQWRRLKRHANDMGIRIIGDVPIFVSGDSADVWTRPDQFLLDRHLQPKVVAGVPPDYFSKTGQRWGNPLYDWKAMAADGFDWWTRRLAAAAEQCDVVRIDHFRGLAACWHVPAKAKTAVDGKWVKSPGHELLKVVGKKLGRLPFIAEDLGVITPDVERLRDDFGLPGMRVLQFAFDGDPNNPFLPHNYVRNCVAYTGTHDNDTTVGWFKSLTSEDRARVSAYVLDFADNAAEQLMRLAWSSIADLAIAPAQDVLKLRSNARMNTPGVGTKNWRWRLPDRWDESGGWELLRQSTSAYGRLRRGDG